VAGSVFGGAEEWALLEDLKISNSPFQIHVLRYIVLANLGKVSLFELVVLAKYFILAGAIEHLAFLFLMAR